MRKIYVALNGNDNNSGSIEAPFLTLEKAVSEATSGDVIYVREGRYHFKKSLEIIGKKNIKISNYDGEKVFFDGGVVVPSDRIKKLSDSNIKERIINKNVIDKMYEADLKGLGIELVKYQNRGFSRTYPEGPSELFINAKAQSVAMYPKKDEKALKYETIDSGSNPCEEDYSMRKPVIKYFDERCNLWGGAKEACITGIFYAGFAHDTIEIEKIDTENKTITMAYPHYFGFKDESYTCFKILNLLEEISEKGEYYIDCENEKLYFLPEEKPENSLIEISSMGEPIVVFENSENVVFEGFTIENSRYSGVYIEGGKDCVVKNCVIRNIGTVAVQIGNGVISMEDGKYCENYPLPIDKPVYQSRKVGSLQTVLYHYAALESNGGKNNGIDSCDIYGIGAGGVLLSGGKRKNLEDAGNYVSNCIIYDTNRLDKTYKAGIHIMGCGNRISNCDIYDMPGFAVYLHGNNHIIEYNNIYDSVKEVADAGAFYMGRDMSEVGNIIRYNYFHDLKPAFTAKFGICALYFDDYCVFNQVYGNYFKDIKCGNCFSAIFWNRGGETSVSNNMFVDCELPLRPHRYSANGMRKKLLDEKYVLYKRAFAKEDDYVGVDIRSDVYKKAYPYLYDLYTGQYSCQGNIWNNIVAVNKDDEFVDYKKGDLTLKESSTAFFWPQPEIYDTVLGINDGELWFEKIDFGNIGSKR